MLKTTKILLTSATLISLSANLAFATNKPLCIYNDKGDLVSATPSSPESVAAACSDSDLAKSGYSAAAALSSGTPNELTPICNPNPVDPIVDPINPNPIIPPCPQLSCDQKLNLCSGNLALAKANGADLEAKVADLNNTISEQEKLIAALKKQVFCANKPTHQTCRPIKKSNVKTAKTQNSAAAK